MALLKRIHTEATRLGGITANLSASELDTIEDYGKYTTIISTSAST